MWPQRFHKTTIEKPNLDIEVGLFSTKLKILFRESGLLAGRRRHEFGPDGFRNMALQDIVDILEILFR